MPADANFGVLPERGILFSGYGDCWGRSGQEKGNCLTVGAQTVRLAGVTKPLKSRRISDAATSKKKPALPARMGRVRKKEFSEKGCLAENNRGYTF